MNTLRRLTPLTGLGGVALVIAGLAADRAPSSDWTDARIQSWYLHHGLGLWLLSAYLVAAGAPLLIAFVAELRQRFAAAGAGERAQSIALAAGIAWAVTLLAGAGLYAAVPAAMTFSDAPAPGADISRFTLGAAYGTIVMFSALAAALLAFTISVVSLRHRVLPRWLAIVGIPASLLMLANAALPMAVITLWYAAASVSLAVRRPTQVAAVEPMAAGSTADAYV
jgi:hypothetical protein